ALYFRLLREPFDELAGVLDVPIGAQAKRLEALEEEEGVLRGEGLALVAESLDARPDGERDVAELRALAEDFGEHESVIAGAGFGEARVAAVAPVERAHVDDEAAERSAVPVDPLRCRVHDDVRAVVAWPVEVTADAARVVDD